MIETATLNELILQAQSLLKRINRHPEYHQITYSPDVTIQDAIAAIQELAAEIK